MKNWQNPAALKRVKTEVEACVARLGGALEAVIATPVDAGRDLAPLKQAGQEFVRVPGTLRMLQFANLALLANEIQWILQDSLRDGVDLESRELDLRLESAFVAVTDLPALLEHSLRSSGDSFELVFKLVNRLRKARGCALVFDGAALLKNEEVSFRKQFASQPDRMQGLLAKQVDFLHKASAALLKDRADARALNVIATVLDNLELMLRDHKIGVLWGLARALVEVYESGQGDRTVLAGCFGSLVPHAQRLAADAAHLQAAVDDALLERVVNLVAGSGLDTGRPRIARLWYNLSLASAKAFRATYRDIQVRYYNKGALTKCLTLISDDCKRMMDSINALAEMPAISREQTRELYAAISKLKDVLRMLRLDYLADIVAARLPATPGEKLDDALMLAASLLFRINNELECKLEKIEREVLGNDSAFGVEEGASASRVRVLQGAMQSLEGVMAALDEHMANAEVARLGDAQAGLDALTNVLATLQLADQARTLMVARDYLSWMLQQPAVTPKAEQHWMLAKLLVNTMRNFERLLHGSAALPVEANDPSLALRAFLDAGIAATRPVVAGKLLVVSGDTAVRAPEMPAVNDAEAVDTPVVEVAVQEEPAAQRKESVDQELLAVFLEEADELLQGLNTLFLAWRQAPQDKASVAEYLRVLHTIKGSAALVCEHMLSGLAHEYETFILDGRQQNRAFDAEFFAACDQRLHALHDVFRLYGRDAAGHLVKAEPVSTEAPADAAAPVPEAAAAAAAVAEEPVPGMDQVAVTHSLPLPAPPPAQEDAHAPDEQIRVSSKLLKSLLNDADDINASRSRVETSFQEVAALLLDMDVTLARFKACVSALDHQAHRPAQAGLRPGAGVRNAEFDTLEMDRYTELQELAVSLAENHNDLQDMRANLGARVKDIGSILEGQQRLNNGLQDGLILTQMVPFSSVVPRLSRLVRQIASQLDKPVRLEVENQQGSLDRNILQAIITPLEHIVRNAIDHGIEPIETRRQRGKPDEATLHITVARRGASFRIEIRDDGQGIDIDKVRQQAIRIGLLKPDALITEREAHNLLFQSGFSTAAAVSSISGRGVGLDVVKSELAEIGGTVEIESQRGRGATFILNLPLTSSLNRALVFAVQDSRYAVLMNTLDGVLVERLATVHQKQLQEGKPLFDYGGKRYEYLYLGTLIDPGFKPRLDSIDSSISLLLVSGATANYALHIDAIVESRDLVVKSLGQQFASMPGIAGGVILPDGNVAIVLDLKSLLAPGRDRSAEAAPLTLIPRTAGDKQRKLVMVVDDSVTVRKASSAMLKRNGMDVILARNGVEALELLETNLPDLILLDIEMPRMDGFEVASWIRSHEKPVCDIPIIMITSRIGEKHRSRAEAIGVNEYLCKPFKEDSLLQSIHGY